MKKILMTTSALLLTTTLAACGGANDNGAADDAYDYNQVTYGGQGQEEDRRITDLNGNELRHPYQGTYPMIPEDRMGEQGDLTAQPDEKDVDEVHGDIHEQVVQLTNEAREEQGLEPLKFSKEVTKVAQEKSEDMSENNYFSHTSPEHGSPSQMLQDNGVDFRAAAENIASGQRSPEEVVEGWLNSEGHRKNIMNENMTEIGVGFEEDGNYWTQMFIGK
ncbi:CAP domain-containing protein [Halobacillus sp. A1]|uniref:CAP domain-containing protein n=1 Tax=Halobacillus sp. A1 TaxID=2880262 RepID=UPI0020A68E09|nr:CAP domain-containing protein [Halobacillus sp. A1]MCP3030929.1 CAP domain-containing protein [Halobacillus sp. A1]